MSHETAFELLPLLSLDALEEADARAVEVHVQRCAICRNELATYAGVAAALTAELEPGPDVWPGILSRIEVR